MYMHGTTSPFPSTSERLLSPLTMQVISLPLLCKKYQQTGNFPWYMTDSVADLEDSYSEVVMNVIDLALNCGILCKHELWKCPNCVHSTCVKSFGGGGGEGLIVETNCILEYKPPPTLSRM